MNVQLEVTDIACRILSDGFVSIDERLWLDDICEEDSEQFLNQIMRTK